MLSHVDLMLHTKRNGLNLADRLHMNKYQSLTSSFLWVMPRGVDGKRRKVLGVTGWRSCSLISVTSGDMLISDAGDTNEKVHRKWVHTNCPCKQYCLTL